MSGPKHTPLPWRQAGVAFEIKDATGETVGFTLEADDAALIVRAVNAHADLLGACEAAAEAFEALNGLDETGLSHAAAFCHHALAKARGA